MTPLPLSLRLCLVACCALPLLAHAGDHRAVYKCSAAGKTTYADRPCEAGTSRVTGRTNSCAR